MNRRLFETLLIIFVILQILIVKANIGLVEASSCESAYNFAGIFPQDVSFTPNMLKDGLFKVPDGLPFLVYLHYQNKVYPVLSFFKDVNVFLRTQLGLDKTFFAKNSNKQLYAGSHIYLHRRLQKIQISYEKIKFRTTIKADSSLPLDTRKKVRKGKEGRVKVIKLVEYVDNKPVSSKVIDRIVEIEPVDEIIALGTKKVCKTANVDGKEIRYWKKLRVWATSYDHTCAGCSHWTATGKYLTDGIIAVDPRVIDLHTTMYVPGYGFGQAEDTGGAIKGNHIDLGFEDLNKGTWSARWVDIYLIDHCMPEVKFNWRTKWDR